jgi:two-component system, NtrC family, response regulator AtoC
MQTIDPVVGEPKDEGDSLPRVNALGEIVGDSPGIQRPRGQLDHILKRAVTAPRPPAILIRGETGTGKGLGARTRAGPPFVDVNCAPILETLLEAELFGYARGVFTDARQAKPGLVGQPENTDRFVDALLGALRKVPEGS